MRQTECSWVPADGKKARLTAPHQSTNSCWGQQNTYASIDVPKVRLAVAGLWQP
jgi:hypothetical protein